GAPSIDTDGLMARGASNLERLNFDELNRSISLLEQAVEADPKFGAAYASLAIYYQAAADYDSRMLKKARATARHAIEIEPRLGEAHATLGYIYFLFDWKLADAASEFQLALEHEPRILTSYRLGADVLTLLGRAGEALGVLDRARMVYRNHPVVE